jgi:hypothetical protein
MKTKQFFASLLMLCSTGLYSYAQTADIPTIIVFPENRWMLQYGFASEIDDDGKSKVLPDYDKAFNNNAEIADAITAVQDVALSIRTCRTCSRAWIKNVPYRWQAVRRLRWD